MGRLTCGLALTAAARRLVFAQGPAGLPLRRPPPPRPRVRASASGEQAPATPTA